jgi:hypothetical protein
MTKNKNSTDDCSPNENSPSNINEMLNGIIKYKNGKSQKTN